MKLKNVLLPFLLSAAMLTSSPVVTLAATNSQNGFQPQQDQILQVLTLNKNLSKVYAEANTTASIDGTYTESTQQIWSDSKSKRSHLRQSTQGIITHIYINANEHVYYQDGEQTYHKQVYPTQMKPLWDNYMQGNLVFIEEAKVGTWDTLHFVVKGSAAIQHIWLDKQTGVNVKYLVITDHSYITTTLTMFDNSHAFTEEMLNVSIPPQVKVETVTPIDTP